MEVFNTASWPRSELGTLSKELSVVGDRVLDERGKPVPSQRLLSGELAFFAKAVPALGAKRFSVVADQAHVASRATASGATLDSGQVRARREAGQRAIAEDQLRRRAHHGAETER